MSQAKKIRIGLVGLNAPYTGAPTGTNWTANAHLPYLRATTRYEIVALQNSSVERAKTAIKAYDLDELKVKAYGTAEDIAADPDIDLIVTSIRVDKHGSAAIPAIKAGKDIYVEWPLEANLTKARELFELAKTHKVRSVVGMQGSFEPLVRKVKALVESGEIGKVESSTFIDKYPSITPLPSAVGYFADKKIGGNYFTISTGHFLELIHPVLGPISTYNSRLINQHSTISISEGSQANPTSNTNATTQANDVPTQILLDAVMTSGAHLTFKLHNSPAPHPGVSPPAKDPNKPQLPALDWRMFGTAGEIRVTSTNWAPSSLGSAGTKIEIMKAVTGVVEEVKCEDDEDEWKDLPPPARNIARLYEAFANGYGKDGKGQWYPDFEHALQRHELIEGMYKQNGF